jgi:hypothetical protein
MKTRRVFVTIEMETSVSLAVLRNADAWRAINSTAIIHQVSANVARGVQKKPKTTTRKKS